MKRTEILPTLEKLFALAPFTTSNSYKVCWLNGKLDVITTTCPHQPEIVFGIVNKVDIRTGLVPMHWSRLEAKIVAFMTQKGYL